MFYHSHGRRIFRCAAAEEGAHIEEIPYRRLHADAAQAARDKLCDLAL